MNEDFRNDNVKCETQSKKWEDDRLQKLIDNFNKLKQQNSSLQERVQYLETNKVDGQEGLGKAGHLLRIPTNCSSDPSSSMSVSPAGSFNDSFSENKQGSTHLSSSSEEDMETDSNEGKHLEETPYPKNECSSEMDDMSSYQLPERYISIKKGSQKEHKTAWSKMKEIIHHTKVGAKKRPHPEDVLDYKQAEDSSAKSAESRLQPPKLLLTHPSTEDLNRNRTEFIQHIKHKPSPLQPTWQEVCEEEQHCEVSPPLARKTSSRWFKVKNVFLPSPGPQGSRSGSNPSSPIRYKSFNYELDQEDSSSNDFLQEGIHDQKYENPNIHDEVKRDYRQLQRRLSDEFHKKFIEWEKSAKGVGSSFSSGNSSGGDEAGERRKEEELRSYGVDRAATPPNRYRKEQNLTSEFKKKLEEWDRLKGGHMVSPVEPRRKISDWQGWGRVGSQRKKREEKRRGSDSPTRKDGGTVKELAWIDKELNKVEREKQRLDKEREQFNQREDRLKKMKLTLEASKEEVLIPTSTGTFRFHGISEKFTRRLYEWEKAQGIGPEASTFALLDPSYTSVAQEKGSGESGSKMVRSKSIGSVADLGSSCSQMVTRHASSLSLNNLHVDNSKVGQCEEMVFASHFPYEETVYQILESNSSDCEREDGRNNSEKRSSYQYCDESRCLIEKLKKEREMCRELEQNIESLEGRISELSKSLERIDTGVTRSVADNVYNSGQQTAQETPLTASYDLNEAHTEEKLLSCDELHHLEQSNQYPEFWMMKTDDALSVISDLTNHLLDITERLQSCIIQKVKETAVPFTKRRSVPCENLHKIDFWLSSNRSEIHDEYDIHGFSELSAFPTLLSEKIIEIKRILGYLFNKKDDDSRSMESIDQEGNCSPAYILMEEEKDISEKENQDRDTENDCSSQASSFTYHPSDKFDEEPWEWSKPSFRPFQKENKEFPKYQGSNHLESLVEDRSCSNYSDVEHNFVPVGGMYGSFVSDTDKINYDFPSQSDVGCWNPPPNINESAFEVINTTVCPHIVVPTVRKIFSPVCLEGNGETSFVELVINESKEEQSFVEEHCIIEDNDQNKETEKMLRPHADSPIILSEIDYADYELTAVKCWSDPIGSIQKVENVTETEDITKTDAQEDSKKCETKAFIDIGFPPISPLRSRREFRPQKEVSPLKRIMASRQNKMLYDIDLNDKTRESGSSSPDTSKSSATDRNSESTIDKISDPKPVLFGFQTTINMVQKSASATQLGVNRVETPEKDLHGKEMFKASSTSALKGPLENILKSNNESTNQLSLNENIIALEKKETSVDSSLSTPESLRLRALKIQRAKEEFFKQDLAKKDDSPTIEVSEKDICDQENLLLVKWASDGIVNSKSNGDQPLQVETEQKQKSKFSELASKIQVVLRRNGSANCDSTGRHSLAVDENKMKSDLEPTRSCPSSPILPRTKNEQNWWARNPAKKIFRPRGKYTITNK